jgi:pseudomonalisin
VTARRQTARLLVLVALALAGRPAAADDGVALFRAVPRALAHAVVEGPLAPDARLDHVTVVLGVRRRAALEALVAAQQDARSPRHRRWLDTSALADRFAPTPPEYAAARAWFTAHGLTVVRDSPLRTQLVVAGPAAAVEAAFGTRLGRVRVRGRLHRGPLAPPVLPAALGVETVLGLDDLPRFRPLVAIEGGETALAPDDFAAAYAVGPLHDAGLTGAGRAIAVVARSNFRDTDVSSFATRFVGTPPRVQRLLAGADPGILTDPAEQLEVLLDTQWAGAIAPGALVNVVIGSPQGDVGEAIYTAIEQRAGDVISVSFGLCEAFLAPGDAEYFDALFTIANAQGQTVVVSSGDAGSRDCAPDDASRPAVNFLAASPHAVAVGGTRFPLAPDGSVDAPPAEVVWNDGRGAGGGGQSSVFGTPRYQLLAGVVGPSRALPDVALAASPLDPGYVVIRDGAPVVVGGTSAAAPSFASVLALLNERLVGTAGAAGLGQLLPALYRLGSEQARGLRAPVYRDVTSGDIGDFAAGPGFDLASGWGAPLADALAGAVDAPAVCEPELPCLVPARPARRACTAEWLVERLAFDTRGNVPLARQTCRDGDPQCDADGMADGRCVMPVALCVNVLDVRRLRRNGNPVCRPGSVRRVRLSAPGGRSAEAGANRAALEAALGALPLPTRLASACTATVPLVVPAGRAGNAAGRIRARVAGSPGGATARLDLRCVSG